MSEYNTYMTMASANPAVDAVKKTGGSAIFLTATITYTVMALFNLISAFMPTPSPYADLIYEVTGDYSVYSAVSTIQSASIFVALIAMIPTILAAVGLWMAFGACKTKNPRVSTGGFNMVSAVLIVRLVLMCILLALICIVMLIAAMAVHEAMSYVSSLSFYGYSNADSILGIGSAVFTIIFIILILFFAMSIVYYAKAVGTVGVIKKAANGIIAGKKISLFVIVVNFIFVGFGVIGAMIHLAAFSLFSFLSSLLQVTFYVLINIALIQLRSSLENTVHNSMSGTGAVPPVHPQQ